MSETCRNVGHYDRWTCPKCYADIKPAKIGTWICDCGANVDCTRDTEPVCVATVVDETDE